MILHLPEVPASRAGQVMLLITLWRVCRCVINKCDTRSSLKTACVLGLPSCCWELPLVTFGTLPPCQQTCTSLLGPCGPSDSRNQQTNTWVRPSSGMSDYGPIRRAKEYSANPASTADPQIQEQIKGMFYSVFEPLSRLALSH